MHDKRCLAAAIIAAVENTRDSEDVDDFIFRIDAQGNAFLVAADHYLATGAATCTCGWQKAHAYAVDLRKQAVQAERRGDDWYAGQLHARANKAEATRSIDE